MTSTNTDYNLDTILATAKQAAESMRHADIELSAYVNQNRGNAGKIADLMGVAPTYVHEIANGKRRLSVKFVERLATYRTPEYGIVRDGEGRMGIGLAEPDLPEPELSEEDGIIADGITMMIEKLDLAGLYGMVEEIGPMNLGAWLVYRAKIMRAFGRAACIGKLDKLVSDARDRHQKAEKYANRLRSWGARKAISTAEQDEWYRRVGKLADEQARQFGSASVAAIAAQIETAGMSSQVVANRIARCLNADGWQRFQARNGAKVERRYRKFGAK